MSASWLPMRRPSARSTLAPRAILERCSLFSELGEYRCCCRRLLSKRSSPLANSLMSWLEESAEEAVVCDANEGTPLMVEKRLEARFEDTLGERQYCVRGDAMPCSTEHCLFVQRHRDLRWEP